MNYLKCKRNINNQINFLPKKACLQTSNIFSKTCQKSSMYKLTLLVETSIESFDKFRILYRTHVQSE